MEIKPRIAGYTQKDPIIHQRRDLKALTPLNRFREAVYLVMNLNKARKKKSANCVTTYFFCQFNKLFENEKIDEEQLRALPKPVTSKKIMERYDKAFDELVAKDKKKAQKLGGIKFKDKNPSTKQEAEASPGPFAGIISVKDPRTPLNLKQDRTTQNQTAKKFSKNQFSGGADLDMLTKTNSFSMMMRTIFVLIRPKYIRAIIYHILATVTRIAVSFILRQFLDEIEKEDKNNNRLVLHAVSATLLTFLAGVLKQHAIANTCGCKAQTGQVIRGIFTRKLSASCHTFLNIADESLINKMILYEIDHILSYIGELPRLWAIPINLILNFYFIYITLKWRLVMVFIVFMVGVILLSIVKTKAVTALRNCQALEAKRATRIAESIPNMKILKVNNMGWFFKLKLREIRSKAAKFLMEIDIFDSIADSVFEGTPLFCSILIIGSLALFGSGLDIAQAFAAISVLETLSDPLESLGNSFDKMEAYSSAKESFRLLMEDVPEKVHLNQKQEQKEENSPKKVGIEIKNCDFDFVQENQMNEVLDKIIGRSQKNKQFTVKKVNDQKSVLTQLARFKSRKSNFDLFSGSFRIKTPGSDDEDDQEDDIFQKKPKLKKEKKEFKLKTMLKHISLTVEEGQKVCLVGKPGSGFTKSLLALMGEGRVSNRANFRINGSISYLNVRMDNFISGTINDNIILGSDFNLHRLNRIIDLLEFDLHTLRGGGYHQVLRGAKNLSLELQRKILLARWIYEEKDIYLIDDLFDDLNQSEWRLVNEALLMGELKDKTVIYMSYDENQIKEADHVVIFENGRIREQGSFSDLMEEPHSILKKMIEEAKGEVGSSEENNIPNELIQRESFMESDSRSQSLFTPGMTVSANNSRKSLFTDRRKIKIKLTKGPTENSSSEKKNKLLIRKVTLSKPNTVQSERNHDDLKLPKLEKINEEEKSEVESSRIPPADFVAEEQGKPKEEKIVENEWKIGEKQEEEQKSMENKPENPNEKVEIVIKPLQQSKEPEPESKPAPKQRRRLSLMKKLTKKDILEASGKVTEDESVDFKEALKNFKKFIFIKGKLPVVVIVIIYIISSFFTISYDLWIGFWNNKTFGDLGDSNYFYAYIALGVVGTLYLTARDIIYDCILHAWSGMINQIVVDKIFRLKMIWYDKQPLTRVMYRLTEDQSEIDINIPKVALKLIESMFNLVAGTLISSWVFLLLNPIVALILICLITRMISRYLRVNFQMSHYISVRKSEVVGSCTQVLNLSVYLRKSRSLDSLIDDFYRTNDRFQRNLTNVGNFSQRWIGIWFTIISSVLVFISFCYPIVFSSVSGFLGVSAFEIGLGITWSLRSIKFLNRFVTSISQVFTKMISINRLCEYWNEESMLAYTYNDLKNVVTTQKKTKFFLRLKNTKKIAESRAFEKWPLKALRAAREGPEC